MIHTTDGEIRIALHATMLQAYHECKETLVIDELGLIHGKNRIDIAVLNGCLHGYEIKSSKDTLNRLDAQLDVYVECFEKLTLVVAPNHLSEVLEIAPMWSEVVVAEKDPSKGGIDFVQVREGHLNPDVNKISFAHLLWKNEALELLDKLNAPHSKKVKKIELYKTLAELVTVSELTALVKAQFMKRETWRVDAQLSLGDGLLQLASM